MAVSIGTIKSLNIVKTNYVILLLFAALSSLSIQCKKEQELDKLPSATSVGANTFGCLLNDMAWPDCIKGDKRYSVSYGYGFLIINYAIEDDGPSWLPVRGSINFAIKNIYKPGIYIVPFKNTNKGSVSVKHLDTYYFSEDPINKGGQAYFTITRLDSVNRIFSGTFEFTLFDQNDFSNKVEVKSGRFDL